MADRNPLLDITFDCLGYDGQGNPDQGVGFGYAIASSDTTSKAYTSTAIAYAVPTATTIVGNLISASPAIAYALADFYFANKPMVGYKNRPAILLSRPGTTEFDIYTKGIPLGAYQTFMETDGYVYQIKKLGNQMIVYGENSIMSMFPATPPVWGRKTLHKVGLFSKNAMCVDDKLEPTKHFAIDKVGRLLVFQSDGKTSMIDYSNWFLSLSPKVVMSYDERLRVVRISDGTIGFTYFQENGLGRGPVNISGCGIQGDTFYIVAPSAIITDPMECSTDIVDFGSRDEHTIYELDFGTEVTVDMYASIDYRWNKADAFYTTPWLKVDRFGKAYFMCSGIEFRIKWKLLEWSYLAIDYLNVRIKYADKKPINA